MSEDNILIHQILTKKKETKGTVVYTGGEDLGEITFYIPKIYLKGTRPETIILAVTKNELV